MRTATSPSRTRKYVMNSMATSGRDRVQAGRRHRRTRAAEVLDRTLAFLEKIGRDGPRSTAIAQGLFADMKRPKDGGKGLEGLRKKGPVLEPLRGRTSRASWDSVGRDDEHRQTVRRHPGRRHGPALLHAAGPRRRPRPRGGPPVRRETGLPGRARSSTPRRLSEGFTLLRGLRADARRRSTSTTIHVDEATGEKLYSMDEVHGDPRRASAARSSSSAPAPASTRTPWASTPS